MKCFVSAAGGALVSIALIVSAAPLQLAYAQQPPGAGDAQEEIVVTGSRIRRDPLNEAAALMELGSSDLDRTGLTNLGDVLQNLPVTGSAINNGSRTW